MAPRVDPLALSRALIRCRSVTPVDAGALDVLQEPLERFGFRCHRLRFCDPDTAPVDNLYARFGNERPNFCFAGHIDVVPAGDETVWTHDPFAADVVDGRLYGRGAADMKTGIACFVAAADRFLSDHQNRLRGAISLLITGDEEGPAVNGTVKVLEWLDVRDERLDACVVGEPTNPTRVGEMIKIGRRGSLNGRLTVLGTQGHAAYPDLADNPVSRLVRMLNLLQSTPIDQGTDYFQPSTLTLTTVDVGNRVTNMIPADARAAFNVRFNDLHDGRSVRSWIEARCAEVGGRFDLQTECSGDAFVFPPGPLCHLVADSVERVSGRTPVFSTTGGTSDARFIKNVCPVVEFGMCGETAHKADEHVAVADLTLLTDIYRTMLESYFARQS